MYTNRREARDVKMDILKVYTSILNSVKQELGEELVGELDALCNDEGVAKIIPIFAYNEEEEIEKTSNSIPGTYELAVKIDTRIKNHRRWPEIIPFIKEMKAPPFVRESKLAVVIRRVARDRYDHYVGSISSINPAKDPVGAAASSKQPNYRIATHPERYEFTRRDMNFIEIINRKARRYKRDD